MRKEMGLRVEEYVMLEIAAEEGDDLALLEKMQDYLRKEIRAKKLNLTPKGEAKKAPSDAFERDWEFDGRRVTIRIARAKLVKAQDRLAS
jgi:hypothetical protein